MKKQNGFTLIELLVVISIISILSMVGFVSYQNVRNSALSAKRKADIDAIKKAYETNFDPILNGGQGGYKPLTGANFASGSIPTPPGGGSYIVIGPDTGAAANNTSTDGTNGPNYAACVNLADGTRCGAPTPLTNNTGCYCASSVGGTTLTTNTSSSCDAYGILNNGLVGWWKMDEGTGTNAQDSSVQNHNGIVSGSPIWSSTEKFGGSLNFDGLNDYVSLGTWFDYQTFTITFWAKPSSTQNNLADIIDNYHNETYSWVVQQNGTSTNNYGWFTNFNLQADTWQHVVLTKNGTGAANVYINSISVGTANGTSLINYAEGSQALSLGRWGRGATRYWKGALDDVRIYNRVLSAGEISLLYNDGAGCLGI